MGTIHKHDCLSLLKKFLLYILAALIVLLNAGLCVRDQTLTIDYSQLYDKYKVALFCGVALCFFVKQQLCITPNKVLNIVFLLMCLVSYLFCGSAWNSTYTSNFFFPLIWLVALLVISGDKEYLWYAFTNVVCVISAISLVFYVFGTLLHIIPPMTYINRVWGSWDPKPIANYYYLYYEAQITHHSNFDVWRNCGMFAEAPMFNSLLCVALAAESFLYKRLQGRVPVIVLLVITIITTFSTTGFLFLSLWGFFGVLNIPKVKALLVSHKKMVIAITASFATVAIIAVLLKFTSSAGAESASIRVDHTLTCFKLLKHKLLFGYGWEQKQALFDAARYSFGPSVGIPFYLYTGGLVLGSLIFVPYIQSVISGIRTKKSNLFLFDTLFLFVFFFTAITSYPMVQLYIAYNFLYSFEEDTQVEISGKRLSKNGKLIVGGIVFVTICLLAVADHELYEQYRIKRIASIENPIPIETNCFYDVNDLKVSSDFRSDSWFYIRGWYLKQGVESSEIKLNVVLINQNSGEGYRIPTDVSIRTDVTSAYNDGTNYDESGFVACVSLNDILIDEYKYYDVVFEVESEGQTIFYNPSINLAEVQN